MRAELYADRRAFEGAGGIPFETLTTVVWAVTITALPVLFHLAGQWAGIATCILLSLMLACLVPAALPGALVLCWVFQSLVVSLVSPAIAESDLTPIRAYSFLTTVVAWLVITLRYWTERQDVSREFRIVMTVSSIPLVAIAVYTAIGMSSNPSAAVIYLRSLAVPLFLFQIFAFVAYRQAISLVRTLLVAGLAIVAYGYAELLAHDALFSLVNGDHFMSMRVRQEYEAGAWLKQLQESGRVMRSYLDTLLIDLFNTPLLADLNIQIYRLVGPNFHPISFAYALAFFTLVAASTGQLWFALLSAPLLLIIGSKGAVILTLFVLLLLGLRRFASLSTVIVACLAGLTIYAAAGIAIGISTQDYHVIGLLGGLTGFLKNPIGHGIGVGGNLSMNMAETINWSRSQALGQTDVAVESAVGVVLYQMGIAAGVLAFALIYVASRLLKIAAGASGKIALMCALSILTLIVNGLFQEEAMFAPLALALMLGFSGFVLGDAYRERARRRLQPRYRVARSA